MPANIVGLLDYYDAAYNAPVYDDSPSSYDANRAQYTKWRKLWAKRHFHEACEDYDPSYPDRPILGIIDLLHHPDFPEVFQQKLCGALEGEGSIHPVDVKDFLEDKYAKELERPDWEYLKEVLTHIEEVGPKPNPQTIKHARQWLESKRSQLLVWPPVYGEPDAKGRRKRLKNLLAFDAKILPVKPLIKFENLISPPFSPALLHELLFNLQLLKAADTRNTERSLANPSASPGAWGGVFYALRKHRLLDVPSAKICKALEHEYQARVSEKTLQNASNQENTISMHYYKLTLSHLKKMRLVS